MELWTKDCCPRNHKNLRKFGKMKTYRQWVDKKGANFSLPEDVIPHENNYHLNLTTFKNFNRGTEPWTKDCCPRNHNNLRKLWKIKTYGQWVKHGFVLGCFGNMKLPQTKKCGLKSLRAFLVRSDEHEMTVNP